MKKPNPKADGKTNISEIRCLQRKLDPLIVPEG